MMTIGANELPILDVPRGCIKKRHMRIPQEAPIIVDEVMFGTTTSNLRISQSSDRICVLYNVIVQMPKTPCEICFLYLCDGIG